MSASPAKAETPAWSEFERRELDRRRSRVAVYDAIAEGRVQWVERDRYYASEVHRFVGSLIPAGSRVLEVGCGIGDLLAALPGRRGIGIDVSSRMIAIGRGRHPSLDLRVAD